VTPIGNFVDRMRPYFVRQPKVRPAATAPQPAAAAPQSAAQPQAAPQKQPAAAAAGSAAPAQPTQPQAPAVDGGELAKRRERLAREFAELQWDLGGLTYEMAIRDHFRLDLLVRQAAKLQQVDAELGSVDRLLHMEQAGAAGTCPSCGALFSRGAVYCWQCGKDLMPQSRIQAPTQAAQQQPPSQPQAQSTPTPPTPTPPTPTRPPSK
jgi:hypothetical protein